MSVIRWTKFVRLLWRTTMSTDGFLWMMRERDQVREEVRDLKRQLAEKEKKLAELTALIERETAPRASA
jgi:hypothetical protein